MRIVSNTPNFFQRSRKYKERMFDVLGEQMFRAQSKNSFGAWVDVSPLMDENEMRAWLDQKGLVLNHSKRNGFQVSVPKEKLVTTAVAASENMEDPFWLHRVLESIHKNR